MSESPKLETVVSTPQESTSENPSGAEQDRVFPFFDRVKIWAISIVGFMAVQLIGRTLRWEVFGYENYDKARSAAGTVLYCFWHSDIFPAIWFWRKRGIVVMVSQNFDGEYTTKVIHWHGYGTARGSSSRRAAGAVVEMIRALREGRDSAVTPDGPRGPRHVVKPGVVKIATAGGAAILCFHILPRHAWVLRRSWDQTQIPKPFSRIAIWIAPPVFISPIDDPEAKLREVQNVLDKLVEAGIAWRH